MMTVYQFRTSTYARNIYMYGTNRLTERDGFVGVQADYYVPVEQFAAVNYALADINNALDKGWINQQEYDETMGYVPVV